VDYDRAGTHRQAGFHRVVRAIRRGTGNAGEQDAALKSFSQVYAMNIDYRDVAERIAALQKPNPLVRISSWPDGTPLINEPYLSRIVIPARATRAQRRDFNSRRI